MKRNLKDFIESDDCISGYVEGHYKLLFNELREFGYRYSVRTSRKTKGNELVFSYASGKEERSPVIKYFGSPFHLVESSFLECSLGPHYYKKGRQFVESPCPPERKRFRITDTKKIDCPAKLTVKCVRVFNDYITNDLSRRSKKKVLDKLKEDLKSASPLQGQIRYFIKANIRHNHSTTVVNLNQSIPADCFKTAQFVDSGATPTDNIEIYPKTIRTSHSSKKIPFVESGITSTGDLKIDPKTFGCDSYKKIRLVNNEITSTDGIEVCPKTFTSTVLRGGNVSLLKSKVLHPSQIVIVSHNSVQGKEVPKVMEEESDKNKLVQVMKELREETKRWFDMSYLYNDPEVLPVIKSAVEVLRVKRLEITKLLPSNCDLPKESLKCQMSNLYKQLPLRNKHHPENNVVSIRINAGVL